VGYSGSCVRWRNACGRMYARTSRRLHSAWRAAWPPCLTGGRGGIRMRASITLGLYRPTVDPSRTLRVTYTLNCPTMMTSRLLNGQTDYDEQSRMIYITRSHIRHITMIDSACCPNTKTSSPERDGQLRQDETWLFSGRCLN